MEEMLVRLEQSFPSGLPEKWQAKPQDYKEALIKILAEWTKGATMGRRFVRVTGQSGSGKTAQLVPAVEAWFDGQKARAIMVSAARLAEYHPYRAEILQEYGEEQVRQRTDGFAAGMTFLVLHELLTRGYDVILDLALVGPELEAILTGWLKQERYKTWMTMVAVSPAISGRWLAEREWRHSKETEEKFRLAMESSLKLYAEKCPEMRVVIWSAWDLNPVYDGEVKDAIEVWRKYVGIEEMPMNSDLEGLKRAKVEYFRQLSQKQK